MKMKGWNQIGVIDTIYEEEREFSSITSPSLSPNSFSSSPPSLHSTVNAWSLNSGCETDVLIRVQGTCFGLHKDHITSRSSYLKRHLTEGVSEFTLSPPLNITAETFAAVVEFCYSRKIQLTPSNVAAIRTAAELLSMKEGENLCDVAELYLQRIVDSEASTILRSCLPLLPEAASVASRCIEALIWESDGGNVDDDSWLDVLVELQPQDFQIVAYSLNEKLPNHDVLYKLVELYIKENKYGKLTEEQKSEICSSIDCTKLPPRTLVDCVQNPIMPLRFIMRAILVEHLTTRRTVVAAAATTSAQAQQQQEVEQRTSLREFLQRDTARRQAAQLKEAMESTYSRIQILEKELSGMKKFLQEHQNNEEKEQRNVLNSERSVSFHFVSGDHENSEIQRGGRGSVSSSGFVIDNVVKKNNEMALERYKYNTNGTPKNTNTSFRHRFITGLKSAFRISNSASNLSKLEHDDDSRN